MTYRSLLQLLGALCPLGGGRKTEPTPQTVTEARRQSMSRRKKESGCFPLLLNGLQNNNIVTGVALAVESDIVKYFSTAKYKNVYIILLLLPFLPLFYSGFHHAGRRALITYLVCHIFEMFPRVTEKFTETFAENRDRLAVIGAAEPVFGAIAAA